MEKKIIKCDETEIQKYKFHQYKSSISIDNKDVHKIVVSNKISFDKNDFKYFIGYKDAKKLNLYAYSFQKWVYIERILIKLSVCLFW